MSMKKDKTGKLVIGSALIALGIIWLGCNALSLMSAWLNLGWEVSFGRMMGILAARLWPLIVLGAGVALCLPPLTQPRRRELGGMWIPGMAVLTTGMILAIGSLTGHWGVWAQLWPLELIGVAVGFVLAFIFTRNAGLLVPSVIVGLNGLIFLFCSLTGFWSAWAVLWALEPLSVGLALLALYFFGDKSPGLLTAALILSSISGIGFIVALLFLAGWFGKICGGLVFIVAGAAILLWALMRSPKDDVESTPTAEAPTSAEPTTEEAERVQAEDNYGAADETE